MLILFRNTKISPTGLATANTYSKPIIPFRIDHSAYNPAIMIYLAAIHYILIPGNPTVLRQLVEAVKIYGIKHFCR